jgi:hypothetical protein
MTEAAKDNYTWSAKRIIEPDEDEFPEEIRMELGPPVPEDARKGSVAVLKVRFPYMNYVLVRGVALLPEEVKSLMSELGKYLKSDD